MSAYSYEELRAVFLDVISVRTQYFYEPSHYEHLRLAVAESFARREGGYGVSSILWTSAAQGIREIYRG